MNSQVKSRLDVLLKGVFAGLAIAFGGLLFLLSSAFVPTDFFFDKKLIGALLFPVGLLLICFLKWNLYTGKIGMAFRNKSLDKKGLNTIEWLFWILLGNAIGAVGFGYILFGILSLVGDNPLKEAALSAANSRVLDWEWKPFLEMAYRSILCGMLVYIAVFFFGRLNTVFGKVIGIVVPIAFFVYAGFQHCIANMFYLAAGNAFCWSSFVALLVAIAGNSVGAILLDLFVKYDK